MSSGFSVYAAVLGKTILIDRMVWTTLPSFEATLAASAVRPQVALAAGSVACASVLKRLQLLRPVHVLRGCRIETVGWVSLIQGLRYYIRLQFIGPAGASVPPCHTQGGSRIVVCVLNVRQTLDLLVLVLHYFDRNMLESGGFLSQIQFKF